MSLGFLVAPIGPTAPGSASAATDRLPDLRMARLADFRIVTLNGRKLLRFSSTMTNLGAGPFEIRSSRASTSSPWNVEQVIYDDGGGSRRLETAATMKYGGDGHGHWHVQGMVDVDLWSTLHHAKGEKIGYCFFDTTVVNLALPGAPLSPVYRETTCARETGLTSRVGISVGWGDKYKWSLPFQWVDVTGLPAAEYRIRAIVDPRNLFAESSDTNNCTYTRLQMNPAASTVSALGSGSKCTNDWSGTTYAADIAWALETGLSSGCGVDLFCPNDQVTRAEVATWLARGFDLPTTTNDYFSDDESRQRGRHQQACCRRCDERLRLRHLLPEPGAEARRARNAHRSDVEAADDDDRLLLRRRVECPRAEHQRPGQGWHRNQLRDGHLLPECAGASWPAGRVHAPGRRLGTSRPGPWCAACHQTRCSGAPSPGVDSRDRSRRSKRSNVLRSLTGR